MSAFLIYLDSATFRGISDGAAPSTPWSHDRNLLQFAQVCLDRGHEVAFADVASDRFAERALLMAAVYPTYRKIQTIGATQRHRYQFVVSCYPEILALRAMFRAATIVGWFAACHFLESPEALGVGYFRGMRDAARDIDVLVTQTSRMADILRLVFTVLGRESSGLPIAVAPQTWFERQRQQTESRKDARAALGVPEDAIAILNAGGVWRWTDFLPFAQGFRSYTLKQPDSKLHLIISGYSQTGNTEHDSYIAEVRATLDSDSAWKRARVTDFHDWNEGGRRIGEMLAAADFGLNVNAPSLEAWQAYRIRVVEYLRAGLPLLTSPGDYFGEHLVRAGSLVATAHDAAAYETLLERLEQLEPGSMTELRDGVEEAVSHLGAPNVYGALVDELLALSSTRARAGR